MGGVARGRIMIEQQKSRSTKRLSLLLRRAGSNHRPSGYEPDELPLLYSAILSTHFWIAVQRYNKNCTYANFFRKKCIFWQKIAYGLQFATVASGECASAQAASEGTIVSLIERAKPAHGQIIWGFLTKKVIFLCIFLRICVFFSNFAPYFVHGYATRARNDDAE